MAILFQVEEQTRHFKDLEPKVSFMIYELYFENNDEIQEFLEDNVYDGDKYEISEIEYVKGSKEIDYDIYDDFYCINTDWADFGTFKTLEEAEKCRLEECINPYLKKF